MIETYGEDERLITEGKSKKEKKRKRNNGRPKKRWGGVETHESTMKARSVIGLKA